MVLASDIHLANSSHNERQNRTREVARVIDTTHERIIGIGHTSEHIAHPSFRDLLRRGLPIALRGDNLNLDALIP